jgi:hypothetical protein
LSGREVKLKKSEVNVAKSETIESPQRTTGKVEWSGVKGSE